MEGQKQIPREAIKLYDLYIHSEIPRREFLDRLNMYTAAGLALPTLVAALMPNYAAGQVVAPTDPRIKTSYETIPSPNGNGSIEGLLARPASASATTKLPSILVIHENRGLNPHIEDVARRFPRGQLHGVRARRPDVGGWVSRRRRSRWAESRQGRPHEDGRGPLRRSGMAEGPARRSRDGWASTGFCFGGGISNALAVRMGANLAAAAPYYGGAPAAANMPEEIKAAVLVHHGSEDARLVMASPEYEAALKANKVTYEGHIWPGAVHGFNKTPRPALQQGGRRKVVGMPLGWFNKYVRG